MYSVCPGSQKPSFTIAFLLMGPVTSTSIQAFLEFGYRSLKRCHGSPRRLRRGLSGLCETVLWEAVDDVDAPVSGLGGRVDSIGVHLLYLGMVLR